MKRFLPHFLIFGFALILMAIFGYTNANVVYAESHDGEGKAKASSDQAISQDIIIKIERSYSTDSKTEPKDSNLTQVPPQKTEENLAEVETDQGYISAEKEQAESPPLETKPEVKESPPPSTFEEPRIAIETQTPNAILYSVTLTKEDKPAFILLALPHKTDNRPAKAFLTYVQQPSADSFAENSTPLEPVKQDSGEPANKSDQPETFLIEGTAVSPAFVKTQFLSATTASPTENQLDVLNVFLFVGVIFSLFLFYLKKSKNSRGARSDHPVAPLNLGETYENGERRNHLPSLSSFSEKKIFFDARGRRWLKVKTILVVIIFDALVILSWLWPTFINPQDYEASGKKSINYPAELAYSKELNDPLIIGDGHLQRIVKIEGEKALDPFTNKHLRDLSQQEQNTIKDRKYAIDRFGSAGGKFLAITFDDGPDPRYSGEILNILSKEHVPATFFVVGKNAVEHKDITKRMVDEGHMVANHTMTHMDFDKKGTLRGRTEIIATDNIIRAVTGYKSDYIRIPYAGNDEASVKNNVRGILQAQQLGLTVASFDVDTDDWLLKDANVKEIVNLDGQGHIILMHDSGGDRTPSINYLKQLIAQAKAKDYKFVTMAQITSNPTAVFGQTQKSQIDRVTLWGTELLFHLPSIILNGLFVFAIVSMIVWASVNSYFAIMTNRRKGKRKIKKSRRLVSVVLAAYNEELVIEKTVRSIFSSNYKNIELIVVNDGSSDDTLTILRNLKRIYPKMTLINQTNVGKARALNRGINASRGKIIVTLDADTIFLPDTIARLASNFDDPQVGAAAGFVKAGNQKNLITRWQALEYISGITLERYAQSFFGRVMIVPGAGAAWRREAIYKVGGYSSDTMAEDCDLTLTIQKHGYKAITDIDALALTEVPKTMRDLARQRFRWLFGNLQAFWKHKDMVFKKKYGFLGLVALPQAILSIVLPLLFLPLSYFVLIQAFMSGRGEVVLMYFAAFLVLHFVVSLIAVALAKEKMSLLSVVPIHRFIYEPLRTYLLYSVLLRILKGNQVGWRKVKRTGAVKYLVPKEELTN